MPPQPVELLPATSCLPRREGFQAFVSVRLLRSGWYGKGNLLVGLFFFSPYFPILLRCNQHLFTFYDFVAILRLPLAGAVAMGDEAEETKY